MILNTNLSFDIATAEIVAVGSKKGKISKGSDNYFVLKALFNQEYLDDYNNKATRPNGTRVNNTVKRISDLKNKYNIGNIMDEWVDGVDKGDYKRFWMTRQKGRK